ncbi:MAG TPA: carbohydrate ABC transporter permease [Firmicutes bacterium]|nr:carbohydrate ABC transporter permease [Bacillota bacterium]
MSIALPFRRKLKGEPWGIYLLLTIMAIIVGLPLYLMTINAFKPLEELLLWPPRYYVMNPTLEHFTDLLLATNASLVPFSRYVFNSLFIASIVVTASVLTACMCAYPLAKSKAPGVKLLFNLIVAALMFSSLVTAIPRFLIISGLGMIDTYWALTLPVVASSFYTFFMRQFFEAQPSEILDAGRIDGAGEWQLFWKLVMPLAKPAWATLTIMAWQGAWNDEASAIMFTRSEAMKTLPLAIQTIFSGAGIARLGAGAAAALLTTAPTVIIFIFLQKRVIATMAHAGIKG